MVSFVHFTAKLYISWPFGNFSPCGLLYREKSGNPGQKFNELDEKWTESDEVEQNNWAQKKIVFLKV
jgi:hypothetical protein